METDGAATRANEDDLTAAVEAGAVVRTFLIADVRGYTSFTQAHGDEEAGRLAARFAVLARDAVTATAGEVIELRGDEALCVFPSARQGLRDAVELQIHFRTPVKGEPVFQLGIGIGLADGEAITQRRRLPHGGALNLAERLCSVATPGQILASEMVTSLAGTLAGVRFVERRRVRRERAGEASTYDTLSCPSERTSVRSPLVVWDTKSLLIGLCSGGGGIRTLDPPNDG